MTLEESWKLKYNDKVRILIGHYAGMIGFIAFDDRLYNEEPIPVQIPNIHYGSWYSNFKYQDLEKIS